MINRQGRNAPFSRYNKLASRTKARTAARTQVKSTPSNPALEGMKHTQVGGFKSLATLDKPTSTPKLIKGNTVPHNIVRTGLEDTIGGGYGNDTAPEWGTEEYQQGMYNLAREQISGQTAADVDYARTELGGRGFRAGEGGIANRALMDIRRKGSETLGQESRKMAMQGMGAKYGQQQDLMNMIMQKYGIDVNAQQNRFDPYYDTERQYAGIA